MSDDVLEAFIRKYISSQDVPEVNFAWQGGEPTLMGVDFFQKVVRLQKKYAGGKHVSNSIQTNGVMLDEEWCRFLKKHGFLVGLSLDGPEEIHNTYRLDRAGKPTFRRVMNALKLMKKHGVEFNVLACVSRASSERPLEVYRFLRAHGVRFIQFIPIVERPADSASVGLGLQLSTPPVMDGAAAGAAVTDWSVRPEAFGDFLNGVFDEWVARDVGQVYVMNFEWALAAWAGVSRTVCSFAERCGDCVVIEHNGDVYSCDHYVYPEYRLGNVLEKPIGELVGSEFQLEFGAVKETRLTGQCRACEYLFACRGECPKHRVGVSDSGEAGHSYLCAGYMRFFAHVRPYMEGMLRLLQSGRAAAEIMKGS